MSQLSKLDIYYRKLQLNLSQFYKAGWGSIQDLTKIIEYRRQWVGKRENCLKFIPNDYTVHIDKEYDLKTHSVVEGSFISPFVHSLPELFPEETKKARFQFLVPKKWWNEKHKPVVFHFAGTGDHAFWRRRLILAQPLLIQHNVGSIIIENPFYGCRKPKNQTRSNLNEVKDLFVLGAGLVTEALVLMNWCERLGFGPFVLTGLSMGGHMACLASTVWPKALALVPCISWTTASTVFTRGVMSTGVDWKKLEEQYNSNEDYRKLKHRINELHYNENLQRKPVNKQISIFSPESNIDLSKLTNFNKQLVNKEIFEFMTLLMDECTHLINYDIPYDTSLVRVIAAKDDAYILRDGVNDFNSIWPGSTVEYIDEGHVSAFVRGQSKFRESIIKILEELIKKHYS